MTIHVLAQESGTTGLAAHRHLIAGIFAPLPSSWPLDVRSGIIYSPGCAALTSTGAMTAEVAPFRAVVRGGSSPAQSAYLLSMDAAEPVTIPDGGAIEDRYDWICLVVRDDPYDASGAISTTMEVLPGTSGGPDTPPATYLPLWSILVPAGTSAGTGGISWGADLDDQRTYTGLAGAPIVAPSITAERTRGDAMVVGQQVHDLTNEALYEITANLFALVGGRYFADRFFALEDQTVRGAWAHVSDGPGFVSHLYARWEGDVVRLHGYLASTVTGSGDPPWPEGAAGGGVIPGLSLPFTIVPAESQAMVIGTQGAYSGADNNPAVRITIQTDGQIYLRRIASTNNDLIGSELNFYGITYIPGAVT